MNSFAKMLKNASGRGLHIQQFTIESNHVHLICEADNSQSVSAGIMSLKASIVWTLRQKFRYYGRVFADRYYAHYLRTPTEMKNALRYDLFNHAKHTQKALFADVYSSVFGFADVTIFANLRLDPKPPWFDEICLQLVEARSWMQRCGWYRGR